MLILDEDIGKHFKTRSGRVAKLVWIRHNCAPEAGMSTYFFVHDPHSSDESFPLQHDACGRILSWSKPYQGESPSNIIERLD